MEEIISLYFFRKRCEGSHESGREEVPRRLQVRSGTATGNVSAEEESGGKRELTRGGKRELLLVRPNGKVQ